MHDESGKSHPVYEAMNKLRQAYVNLGFEEMVNPIIIEESDISRQFNYEALAVLDRVFYIGGLPARTSGSPTSGSPRSDQIFGRSLTGDRPGDNPRDLPRIRRARSRATGPRSSLPPGLKVQDSKIAVMIDHVFPEFKKLDPVCSRKTLRSHMTSGWFITLGALVNRRATPLKLFSVDLVFRREQEENADRLRAYHSASCVIMDPDVNVEHGKAVAAGLLKQFGFSQFKFKPDDKRSKY